MEIETPKAKEETREMKEEADKLSEQNDNLEKKIKEARLGSICLLYTSPSPRD